MARSVIRRAAIGTAAWLPFFVLWTGVALSSGQVTLRAALMSGAVTVGSAGVLGIAVWFACERWPWPAGFRVSFYVLQIALAAAYGIAWTAIVVFLESLRGAASTPGFFSWVAVYRQVLLGVWFYAVSAGLSYAVQTRTRLHDKEILAARAEALLSTARLEALRARLNPHFLFNALHTLDAIERLGDMLRYTLKEDGRGVVEFSEEYEFTRQYLAFEQLRYEDRLAVTLDIAPESFDFDIPPFSIQTLAENAVRHAIAIRPEGGSIWITCRCHDGSLQISVRDDGPGIGSNGGESHQLGLRSVRERLLAAFGPAAELRVERSRGGFQAGFTVPATTGEGSIQAEGSR